MVLPSTTNSHNTSKKSSLLSELSRQLDSSHTQTKMLLLHPTTELCESIMGLDTDSISCYTPSSSSTSSSSHNSQDWEVFENPGSSSYNSYWDAILTCPCCSPLYHDDRLAESQASSDFPSIPYLTSDYADFRASSRSKQRQRKIRENKSGCNSYRCRSMEQAQQDTRNLKKKREGLKWAVRESQRDVPWFTQTYWRKARHCFVEWDTKLEEELDEEIHDSEDGIVRYITLYHGVETFESEEPYVQIGETFAVWCQRRIAEMRAVKEGRIRHGKPESSKQMLWKTKLDWRYRRMYDIYTSDAGTTTLPTNAYDALGHELLRSTLANSRWMRKKQRISIRPINGYYWFGEFDWAWRRNMSGCWEIGYTGRSLSYGWEDAPIFCPRCGAGSECSYYKSFCKESRCFPAPEEMQRCSLVEWVGQSGKKIITLEEARGKARLNHSEDDIESSDSESGSGWEVISSASSDAWSIIDT